ncbi:MAG: hypothetical protein EOP13_10780 [Pseudomonas sp.]|uniref:transposase n=1 Tax=Pseudomonas sp. TaxID=306 RepID=UPI00120E5884|nr:MAG: hypothetical protein EOP13_10780 [Pseudomonas sp.]
MSNPPRARYRTTNWPAYKASLKRRGSLIVWLHSKLKWQSPLSDRVDRSAVLNDAAIHLCLILNCMFGLDLRQATGLTESLLKVPHSSTGKIG